MDAPECIERRSELRRFLENEDAEVAPLDQHGQGLYSVAGRVAIPCTRAGRYEAGETDDGHFITDIPILIEGLSVGFLCLTSKIRGTGTPIDSATDVQKTAFIKFSTSEEFDAGPSTIKRCDMDCAVIDEEHVEKFLRRRKTSPLWGGFVLKSDAIQLEKFVSNAATSSIVAHELATPRTRRHQAALQRSTESPFVTDRLLHLYHFLELDYDHEVVSRIQAIDVENTRGLEKILTAGRSELDRLHLIAEGFNQIDQLERVVALMKPHRDTALTVFYDYGKEHNPLKDRRAFEIQFFDAPAINRQSLNELKKQNNLESNFARDEDSYNQMLVKLACYWIYRIRCCIAHNKIGEYHLSSAADMKFAGEFGEPLLRTLIEHRLKI
jgi:hypothetical protein